MSNFSASSIHQSSYQPGGYGAGPSGYQSYGTPPGGGQPQLAGLGQRILAFLIDRFLVGIVVGAGYLIGFIVIAIGGSTNSDAGAAVGAVGFLIILVMAVLGLGVLLFNEVYLAGKNNGQTIGKKMMKIRITKDDGTAFGYGDAFLRNLIGYWISSLVCSLGFFWALFDQQRQTWHDKIFKTHVTAA